MTLSAPVRNALLCALFLLMAINAVALILFLSSARQSPAEQPAALASPATPTGEQPAPAHAPARPTLAFANLPSAAATGACLAWDGFARGQMGFEQAKVLLLSGPLRNKSWALQSGAGPRWRLSARSTPALAAALGQARFPAPDAKAGSQLIWTFQTEEEAIQAQRELSESGAQASVSPLPVAPPERRIAILPQGPNEIAYARSLIERMPGSGLSAVACPELAGPALASASR